MSDTNALAHVHETSEAVATVELTPPHPPRVETPAYRAAHSFLINRKNAPCHVCGVTKRTLKNRAKNPCGATALETHHYPIERSLMDACDPMKVHADFPQVHDRATLASFVDSIPNLLVLCDVHHRSLTHGIHHLLTQDFAVQRYLLDGYVVAAVAKDAAATLTADEQIEEKVGMEREAMSA
ncbi:MAG TPA: hypothetical protein VFU72_11270 [Nitrolancea sp.]|nr:hypothetical protein [Nitrolancea sp.]